MKRFTTIALALALLALAATSFAQAPKVKWGGLFYIYDFFHRNTDFNKDTDDANNYRYIHADVQSTVSFGNGVSSYIVLGAWGQHGMSSYYTGGLGENIDPNLRILQAYITIDSLFDTPFSFRIGKERLLYGDGQVVFDGGEDGVTGTKFMLRTKALDVDLFYYRLAQFGGISLVGTGLDRYPGNWDLLGTYITLKTGKIEISPYLMIRMQKVAEDTTNNPLWIGLRSAGSPIAGLKYVAEITLMGGEDKTRTPSVPYRGSALRLGLDYTPSGSPLSFGGAYVSFSGDDEDTENNELYESATNGPYTFGFYKAWPGFGPAHLMTTGYGFSGLAAHNRTMTNLNVINAHACITSGPLSLRFDFYNYSRNCIPKEAQSKAFGNELAVLATYTYRETITFGFTAGIWMPGDHIKKDWNLGEKAGNAIGGYFYLAKSF